jgi:hypothetical protein
MSGQRCPMEQIAAKLREAERVKALKAETGEGHPAP